MDILNLIITQCTHANRNSIFSLIICYQYRNSIVSDKNEHFSVFVIKHFKWVLHLHYYHNYSVNYINQLELLNSSRKYQCFTYNFY